VNTETSSTGRLVRRFSIKVDQETHEYDIYTKEGFRVLTDLWIRSGWENGLPFSLAWMGVPVIQLAEDLCMIQDVIFRTKPDVIVETGTAYGGSAVFYASMLEILGKGRVISIDVEDHLLAIQGHPMASRITLLKGSSADDAVVARVRDLIRPGETVLVALDSDHSRRHVRSEMEKLGGLVTPGSYLVVFDGVMEMLLDAPSGSPDWKEDNPAAAVREFLAAHPEFEVDHSLNRLGATHCPGGFLRRLETGADAETQRVPPCSVLHKMGLRLGRRARAGRP